MITVMVTRFQQFDEAHDCNNYMHAGVRCKGTFEEFKRVTTSTRYSEDLLPDIDETITAGCVQLATGSTKVTTATRGRVRRVRHSLHGYCDTRQNKVGWGFTVILAKGWSGHPVAHSLHFCSM